MKNEYDPIDPNHFPSLHAYLKSQAMLPWADKLDHIASLIKKDMDEKLIKFNPNNQVQSQN